MSECESYLLGIGGEGVINLTLFFIIVVITLFLLIIMLVIFYSHINKGEERVKLYNANPILLQTGANIK